MFKARLLIRKGSFSTEYYAIAILNGETEVFLQCPAYNYPSGKEDEGTDRQEGINTTAYDFFRSLVNQINNAGRSVYEIHMDEIHEANNQGDDR
jgi:hypothetical protein